MEAGMSNDCVELTTTNDNVWKAGLLPQAHIQDIQPLQKGGGGSIEGVG